MIYYRKKKKSGKQKPVKDERELPKYYADYNLKVYDSKHRKVFTRKQQITKKNFQLQIGNNKKQQWCLKLYIYIYFLYEDNHANIDYGSQKLGNNLGVQ